MHRSSPRTAQPARTSVARQERKNGMIDLKKKSVVARVVLHIPKAQDGMINTKKQCLHDSCTKHPSYEPPGTLKAQFCFKHAETGMVNVVSKTSCDHDGCTKARRTAGLMRLPSSAPRTPSKERWARRSGGGCRWMSANDKEKAARRALASAKDARAAAQMVEQIGALRDARGYLLAELDLPKVG